MYKFPQYDTFTSRCNQSANVIYFYVFFILITCSSFTGDVSGMYTFANSSEIEGWPWVGGLFTNKNNSSGRFSGSRMTCAILFNLSSPPSWRVPGLLIETSAFLCNCPGPIALLQLTRDNSDHRACLWMSSFFVIQYSRFWWYASIWIGCRAPSHSGFHSSVALLLAIRFGSYIS